MLLFHGTGGDDALIAKIFEEGLRATGGRSWAHQATGIDEHVFVCTNPVGSQNGDPIAFARGRAYRDHECWLVVVDLPPGEEATVVGAVPNGELERYWLTETFAQVAVDGGMLDASRAVIEHARQRGVAARELLSLRVKGVLDGLCARPPDATTLVQFAHAYHRARERDKAKVAASYGLAIPSWFADDPHYPFCKGCLYQLFDVDIVAPDVQRLNQPVAFSRGSFVTLDLPTFCAMLDALDRWLSTYDEETVARVLRASKVTWRELQRQLPPPRDAVPRTFWPDFATADRTSRMRAPDTQLMLSHVPRERVVGAIHLGTRARLSKLVRPSGRQTLERNLWRLARALHGTWKETGRATILR